MKKLFLLSFAILVFQVGCKKDDNDGVRKKAQEYSGETLREWFKLECRIIKETEGFFPPQAARAYGYSGLTAYQAVYGGIPNAESLEGQLNVLPTGSMPQADTKYAYDWAITVNAAMADILRSLFEKKISIENRVRIDSLENLQYEKLAVQGNKVTVDRSIFFGKQVAKAIFEVSKIDGGHESYLNPFQRPYTNAVGNDKWVPTDARNMTPLAPNWSKCTPFLNTNITFSQPAQPVAFSIEPTSEFYKAAKTVYNQVTQVNTSEEVEITKFWADDPFNTCTPSGHTFNILTQLLADTRATLEKSAVAYAKLCVAESDAFIACWATKYNYSLIRPVSYIQKYIDPTFKTVIGTPPFPAYTSGHATESGAGERILSSLFGNGDGNYVFTDRTQMQFGFAPRNFRSFAQMSEECANSRFFGGIHYDFDNKKGLYMGRSIGDNTNSAINWPQNIR